MENKMIIEMRTYYIKVGMLNNFINIYDKQIRKIHIKILGNQIGFFYSEFGDLNKVVHLYGYESYRDRDKRRALLIKQEAFKNYLHKVKDLLVSQKSEILLPTKFSKIR